MNISPVTLDLKDNFLSIQLPNLPEARIRKDMVMGILNSEYTGALDLFNGIYVKIFSTNPDFGVSFNILYTRPALVGYPQTLRSNVAVGMQRWVTVQGDVLNAMMMDGKPRLIEAA